jgi:hypothetical protein
MIDGTTMAVPMPREFPNDFQCGPIKNPVTGKWDVMLIIQGEGTEKWADGESRELLKIVMGDRGEYGKLLQVNGLKPS